MKSANLLITTVGALAILAVVLIAVAAVHFRNPIILGPAAVPEETEAFLSHLQFLWQRYLEMVQLLVTLLTGVIAVCAGMVKLGPRDMVANRGYFASGMVCLLIGLTCAVLWRIDAELLMEMEVFGDPATVAATFNHHGVPEPFTSSFEYLNGLPTFSKAADVFMVGTASGLLAGLAFMSLFAYRNLPEATRHPVSHPSASSRAETGAGRRDPEHYKSVAEKPISGTP